MHPLLIAILSFAAGAWVTMFFISLTKSASWADDHMDCMLCKDYLEYKKEKEAKSKEV